jgi:hypothetical protein
VTFDKQLWVRLVEFHPLEIYPALPCPYCGQQKLTIDSLSLSYRDMASNAKDKAFQRSLETSYRKVSDTFKDNELIGIIIGIGTFVDCVNSRPAKFSGFCECAACGGNVAVVGTAIFPTTRGEKSGEPKLKVEYFSPAVPMFTLDSTAPEAVVTEVLQAFQHFHCDPTASGAKVRRAMEKVCEALGHKKRTLHDSIEALSHEYPQEAKWLRTLKLVGNEASHADRVTEDDLLASFQVLNAVLDVFRRKAIAADIDRTLPAIENKYKRT